MFNYWLLSAFDDEEVLKGFVGVTLHVLGFCFVGVQLRGVEYWIFRCSCIYSKTSQ